MKRFLFILSVVLAAACFVLALSGGHRRSVAAADMVSGEEAQRIKAQRQEYGDVEETAPGALYFDETRLPYSGYNNTFYLSVTEGMGPGGRGFPA